ncbi:hypothetical protein [Alicyclobacillus acidoterrestris]|uniref:Uncharacterized protein n=1 Tax=Alicyclobacillus acidoterrestris (strain ATCC 49025 / DSM 3922 / CIP 106132 / NCIMB 13137 / GD3B) TaxID=1356854 RepID=T0BQ46_ALIAG|nr:hypothetical protein [Alicyclobacillus acidoterrestris]EPZ42889.1 hypothetical protein N007_13885 [Alicyclobacillus acidoterrestris ATCC 49025]UNO50091.1 hypothetical protein K1I37_06275 [Alicyclobacillus acidoterrestris]
MSRHERKSSRHNRVTLFTDDGNEIRGTLDRLFDDVVRLRNVTVRKNGKRRLRTSTLYVVLDKIDSFQRTKLREHHHCEDDCEPHCNPCEDGEIRDEVGVFASAAEDIV